MTKANNKIDQPFILKGEMSILSTMRLVDTDLEQIADLLERKVKQAPAFFQHMPIVLDLQDLAEDLTDLPFDGIASALREHGMIPVGVRNGSSALMNLAQDKGWATFAANRSLSAANKARAEQAEAEKEKQAEVVETDAIVTKSPEAVFVQRQVRSGQQSFSPNGDLVLLSHSSPGSEILAAGSIHIYGTLRGRALAGVYGNQAARIFCQRFEAELVSIAGCYQVFEDIDPALKDQPVQIYLDGDSLKLEPINLV